MRSKTKLFALVAAVLMVMSVFAVPAAAGSTMTAANDSTNDEVDDGDDGNETENETENVTDNESDAFGQEVSAFVHDVLSSNDTDNTTVGHLVANFVLENNPAADKIPDHAGPPENQTRGPPENRTQGPPEDRGPGNETDNGGDGGGPPEDAGSSGDQGRDS